MSLENIIVKLLNNEAYNVRRTGNERGSEWSVEYSLTLEMKRFTDRSGVYNSINVLGLVRLTKMTRLTRKSGFSSFTAGGSISL